MIVAICGEGENERGMNVWKISSQDLLWNICHYDGLLRRATGQGRDDGDGGL